MATTMPPTVAKFFCGKPRDQEYLDSLPVDTAEDFELSFVGEFVPPFMREMKMTYTTLPKGLGNLVASFPNLTFSPQEEPTLQADGGWKASTKVTGTHTGPAFSPAPHLEPVPTSNKEVVIGPEDFTVYTNAEGKITKVTICPMHEGALVGPPGFYISIGGVIKPPPAAAPTAPNMATAA